MPRRSSTLASSSASSRSRAQRRSSGESELTGTNILLIILAIGLVLLVIITLSKSVRVVQQQRMDVVERLGRYQRTLKPGLNILMPYVDQVRTKVDMREQVVSFPP